MPRFDTPNGCFLHYELYAGAGEGDGGAGAGSSAACTPTTVVFLHGYGGSMREWDQYVYLLPNVWRLVMLDLYCMGESSVVHRPAASDEDMENARDIAALMRSLQIERYYIVGHSFGARVAELMAAQNPNNVVGLVLMTPQPMGCESRKFIDDLVPIMMPILERADLEQFSHMVARMNSAPGAPPRPIRTTYMPQWLQYFRRSVYDPASFYMERMDGYTKDRSALLRGLSCPILIISADLDFFFKDTLRELPLYENASVGFHCFHNRGHLYAVEDAAPVAALVRDFVLRHGGRAG